MLTSHECCILMCIKGHQGQRRRLHFAFTNLRSCSLPSWTEYSVSYHIYLPCQYNKGRGGKEGFHGGSVVKSLLVMQETWVWSLGQEDRLEEGMATHSSNPLQYSCLEYSMGRGAWWATIYSIAKSWTRLKWLSMHVHGGKEVGEGEKIGHP